MASKRYIIHQKEQKNKGKLSGFWTWISPDTLTGHVWWIPECEGPLCSPLWSPLWAQAEWPPLPRYPDEPPKKPGRTPVLEPCLSPIAAKKINKTQVLQTQEWPELWWSPLTCVNELHRESLWIMWDNFLAHPWSTQDNFLELSKR